MADPASDRGPLETLSLAGVGAVALVAQHADELADEIARRLGVERDEVRAVDRRRPRQLAPRGRRLGESSGSVAARVAAELGVASREVVGELELRVAQLEHRAEAARARPRRLGQAEPPRLQSRRWPTTAGAVAAEPRAPLGDRAGRGAARVRLLPAQEPPRRPRARRRQRATRRDRVGSRHAPARDARRARADVRQVRPAPLDATRRRSAGHRRRAPRPPGRRVARSRSSRCATSSRPSST